jgi:hypothetical protein
MDNEKYSIRIVDFAFQARNKCVYRFFLWEAHMDKQKRAVLSIEVPLELRETFIAAAAANDMTGSQLLRAFMREYIRKNSHSDLFRPLEKQAA